MKILTGRGPFLIASAWAFLVFIGVHFLSFPGSVPRFKEVSAGGVLLDVSPAFTSDAVYQRLAGYGVEGRRSYSLRNMTVVLLLPLSLLPFLYLFMRKAISSLELNHFLRFSMVSFSFAYVLLDIAENAVVLALLANYPDRLNALAEILPHLTMAKRIASLLAIFVPLTTFGIRSLAGNRLHFHKPLRLKMGVT